MFKSLKLRLARRYAQKPLTKFPSPRDFILSADQATDGQLHQLVSIMSQLEEEEAWMVFKSWYESGNQEKQSAATFMLMAAMADDRNQSNKSLNRGKW